MVNSMWQDLTPFQLFPHKAPVGFKFCKKKGAEMIFPKDKGILGCGYSNLDWNKVLNFPLGYSLAREEKKIKRWNFFQGCSPPTNATLVLSSPSK